VRVFTRSHLGFGNKQVHTLTLTTDLTLTLA
jgi:hypothetical protein